MTEQTNEQNENIRNQNTDTDPVDRFDPGYKFLSDAFRVSFVVLKIIMIILVILFLASGFETVGSDEQAIVLRFGKIRGAGEDRILKPGPHWIFPYPINEIVKIPVTKNINLNIDSFWYAESKKRVPQALDPVYEGYCITQSERQSQAIAGSTGSDYNIVHSKWQLIYKIDDPEKFFKNAYIEKIKPGQSFTDVIIKGTNPLLKHLISSSIVSSMVHYTIDEAIQSRDSIPKHVKKLLQEKLDTLEIGIRAVSVQLTDITWPRQVNIAFEASIRASQTSQKNVTQARGYAENILNEAAGPIAEVFLEAVKQPSRSEQQMEILWQQLAGQARELIAHAKAYRTEVVEKARANAEYLREILPEYKKRPELVVQGIYNDAVEYVLENTDEKMVIQPTETSKPKEIRIQLNRDPSLKSRSKQDGQL